MTAASIRHGNNGSILVELTMTSSGDRLDQIEGLLERIAMSQERTQEQIDRIDQQIDHTQAQIERVDQQVERTQAQIDSNARAIEAGANETSELGDGRLKPRKICATLSTT